MSEIRANGMGRKRDCSVFLGFLGSPAVESPGGSERT